MGRTRVLKCSHPWDGLKCTRCSPPGKSHLPEPAPWCTRVSPRRSPRSSPDPTPVPAPPGRSLPHVPGLRGPLAIFAGAAEPVERRGPAAGPGHVAADGPQGPIGLAGHLLSQLGREAAVRGGRADGPVRRVGGEVVIAVGAQQDPGGSQRAGGPPPPTGVRRGLSEGHWVGESGRGG